MQFFSLFKLNRYIMKSLQILIFLFKNLIWIEITIFPLEEVHFRQEYWKKYNV